MIRIILQQLRVRQWTKNLVVFAGVVFSHHFTETGELLRAAQGFLAFCLLASSVYVLNDLRDVDRDRIHPKKKHRPIASGRLSVGFARVLVLVLLGAAAAVAWPLGKGFLTAAGIYYTLNLAYSMWLKHVVLLDVMIIAVGFVLRAVAGVEALSMDEEISPWLLVCTLFLALFLAVAKRRAEVMLLQGAAADHRQTLEEYPRELVDQLVPVVTAATVISYAIYTVSPQTVSKFETDKLVYTVPFVVYGIFRYLYLVYKQGRGGSPSEVLLTDAPTLFNVLLWIVAVVLILGSSQARILTP